MMISRRSLLQADFAAKIEKLIQAAIRNGATNFPELIHALPAVYPTELLAALDRLAASKIIDPEFASLVHRQAATKGLYVFEGRSLLPPPHPLDFEWRFTADSARSLLDRAAELTSSGEQILLFGTPGLAIEALTLPPDRQLAFLAENNSITDRVFALNRATGSPLSISFCRGGLPRESAHAVILDPPWYSDFIRPMLAASAHACRPNGVVLIVLPPEGARARAEDERNAAIAFGRRLGLDLIEYCALATTYETPFFERNALAATAIFPPPQWRRGDLLVFRKSREPASGALPISTPRRDWIEVSIGRMRLFIRANDKARSEEATLISVIEGDILPTVSRRDPRRRIAQVWTSGNRIFQTDNPQLLLEAAISCGGDAIGSSIQPHLWSTIHEREKLERVADDLRVLATLETREEQGRLTEERERSVNWKLSSTHYWSKSTAIISG